MDVGLASRKGEEKVGDGGDDAGSGGDSDDENKDEAAEPSAGLRRFQRQVSFASIFLVQGGPVAQHCFFSLFK